MRRWSEVSAPPVIERRVSAVDTGIEATDQRARAIDPKLIPHFGSAHRYDPRWGCVFVIVKVLPPGRNRLNQLGLEIQLEIIHIVALREESGCSATPIEDEAIDNPVSRVALHLAARRKFIEDLANRTLAACCRCTKLFDDNPVPGRATHFLMIKLSIE